MTLAARKAVELPRCPASARESPGSPNRWAPARRALAPPGVMAMRLCRYSGLNGSVPAGRLVRSRVLSRRPLVTKLAHEFDELKPFPRGAIACPSDDGSLILALLAYPGGRQVRIEVDRTGCQGVTNGDVLSIADGYGTPVGPRLEHQLNALTAY